MVSSSPPPPRALVTGATGFVGGCVARALAGRGFAVDALVRPPADRLALEGVTPVPGDLLDFESLLVLRDRPPPFVVCHLAADTRMEGTEEEMYANVRGTANLVGALGGRLSGARFLFASSIAAVDRARRPRGPLTETDPPAPRSAYARSKLRCEELLEEGARVHGYSLSVLRLGTVYGPGTERGGVAALACGVRAGNLGARIPWPGRISFVFVEDVAEAFVRLAERELPVAGTWFLAEDRGYSMAEAAACLAEIVSAEKGPLPVPRALLSLAGRALWLPGLRRIAPWSLRAALEDTILCDSGPLTRLLGMKWTPLPEGLARTFG